MPTLFLTLLLVAVVAARLQAQICREEPPPTLSTLFPDQVADLDRESYDMRDGCLTNVCRQRSYIPVPDAEDPMWEVVLIEPHHDPILGGSTENMRAHYELAEMTLYSVAAWPISGRETGVGFEFVTLKGDLQVAVVVKQANDQAAAWLLAEDFFNVILPNVSIPCET
jgi:hypothetical protein